MTTVTGLTAERMLDIEGMSVVNGEIIGGHLILTKHDGTQIDAGSVIGPQGDPGVAGPPGTSSPLDAWDVLAGGWVFGTVDGHTSTMVASGDQTAFVSLGCRIKLTHAAVVKYFIVTGIVYTGGNTTLTLYGGTDYVLAAGAITLPYVSRAKAPGGFPLDPAKWTEELKNAVDQSQGSPVSGTWYNPGALQLAIPIGAWRVSYDVVVGGGVSGTAGNIMYKVALSTTNNSPTDIDLLSFEQSVPNQVTISNTLILSLSRRKQLILAVKTIYYLIGTSPSSPVSLNFYGALVAPTIIRAECAYL